MCETQPLAYPEGEGIGGSNPPIESSEFFLHSVFAKYTVQTRILYSLNPKFSTWKCEKLYTNFTFCFIFWGTSTPIPLPELCSCMHSGHPALDPLPGPHHVNPLHCKILGTPMSTTHDDGKVRRPTVLYICHYILFMCIGLYSTWFDITNNKYRIMQ